MLVSGSVDFSSDLCDNHEIEAKNTTSRPNLSENFYLIAGSNWKLRNLHRIWVDLGRPGLLLRVSSVGMGSSGFGKGNPPSNPPKIQWRYDEDPAMRWKFSFKSGLEVVFLASIPWLSHRSKEKSIDSAKIQRRFGEIRRRSNAFWRKFDEDLEVETHFDFDRLDRCPPEPDSTWPEIAGGWRRVVQLPTRCEQVDSGLGTNLTRTDPWTPEWCEGSCEPLSLVMVKDVPCDFLHFTWVL